MIRITGFLLGLLIAAVPLDPSKEALEAFDKVSEFDLYSLDPAKESKEGFHGWTILGKTVVNGEIAIKVRDSVKKGIGENKDAKGACFNPRHGIRIVREKQTYDLVICFQCLQIYVFEGEKQTGWMLTSNSPTIMLNKVLTDAKVPLPEK